MNNFRQRPVIVQAIQFDGTEECYKAMGALFPDVELSYFWDEQAEDDGPTSENEVEVAIPWEGAGYGYGGETTWNLIRGDWLVRQDNYRPRPCTDEIFRRTYEAVHEDGRTLTQFAAAVYP